MPAVDSMACLALVEGERLAIWAKGYHYPHLVHTAISGALTDLVGHACLGQSTEHGPFVFLATAVADRLREMHRGDAFYVPFAAPLSLPLPTARHLQKVCEAYGVLQAVCQDYTLSVGEVRTLVHGLSQMTQRSSGPWSTDDLQHTSRAAWTIVDRIGKIIDAEKHVGGEVYSRGLSYAAREVARHVGWTQDHHLNRST